MRYRIFPGASGGRLKVPPSKSHAIRAQLFALMAEGTSRIEAYDPSKDMRAMTLACQQLGAQVQQEQNTLYITGVASALRVPNEAIDAENSGLIFRFLTALTALNPAGVTTIIGDASLQERRTIQPLMQALNQLGAKVESATGFAPVSIQGRFSPGEVTMDGADSQPVSALMIAAAFLDGITKIHVKDPGELPWLALTLHSLKSRGIRVEQILPATFCIHGQEKMHAFEYRIPGDFSAAAYPIALSLITGQELLLDGVDMGDIQGDKLLIHTLIQMGAKISFEQNSISIHPSPQLQGMSIDMDAMIDALPILAVIACYTEGETELKNAFVARTKECDRLQAITTELRKMGADIDEYPDRLVIRESQLQGASLLSYNDHRIVMALTIAAAGANGESIIDGIEWVQKSYPHFFADCRSLGLEIQRC